MMTQRLRFVLVFGGLIAFAIILTSFYQPLLAQVGTATLGGVVTDSTGAVIPNAEVVFENISENAPRHTVTNSSGVYVIPSILPGTYRLTVSGTGFTTRKFENLILSSGQGSTVNVVLAVAPTKTEVTVTEKAPLLESTTTAVGAVLEAQAVTTLPLNGRDFSQLILTLPGSVPHGTTDGLDLSVAGNGAIEPTVYGQRAKNNQYMLDGLPDVEIIFGGLPMRPPPEAIAEMKVESGMDTGAYGWASGASINVSTKTGTNNYHGDVWEFLKNKSLNARSYFSPSVGAFTWNQFGGAIGGPLVIPHVLSKNKAWYVFGYYEGIRYHTSAPYLGFEPTAAELSGDFSAVSPIYNPYTNTTGAGGVITRQLFPGNIIPSGPTSLCAPQPTCINAAASLIGTTYWPVANTPAGVIPGVNYIGTSTGVNTSDNWSVRGDHQFSSNDNFFARYSDQRNPQTSVSLPNLPSVTKTRYTNIALSETHTFGPSTYMTTRLGYQRVNWRALVGGPNVVPEAGTLAAFPPYYGQDVIPPTYVPGYPMLSQAPQFYGPQSTTSLTQDIQKIIGRHTIGFGWNLLRARFLTDNEGGIEVDFSPVQTSNFTSSTGFPLASFLLGLPTDASTVIGSTAGDMLGGGAGLYVQDSFRATPKLTLNVGLRWDVVPTLHNLAGSGTFVFETGQYLWDLKNPITGAPPNAPRGIIATHWKDFQPRVGIAYAISPKTVVRAAYGIFYDNYGVQYGEGAQLNRGNWPFSSPITVGGLNAVSPTNYYQDPFPAGSLVPSPVVRDCFLCWDPTPDVTKIPMVQEWDFSVQRQLTPSTKLEVDYFGSHGINNMGQIADNTGMEPGVNSYQSRQMWPNIPPYFDDLNVFPSYYDAGAVSVTRQFSQNLTFLASYTYSKTIDYMDSMHSFAFPFITPTRYDIPSFRGPAGFDMRHRLVASYLYEVPVHTQNRALKAVLGGWQHSGVLQIDSGFPYQVTLPGGSDPENIGIVTTVQMEWPNLVSDPLKGFTRSDNEWFNTSAYQIEPYGTLGNAGKHALYADGMVNWDADFTKKWLFGEGRDVEFRADFFNLPNGSTFGIPGYQLGTPAFGTVNSTRQGGRQIQFALKIHF